MSIGHDSVVSEAAKTAALLAKLRPTSFQQLSHETEQLCLGGFIDFGTVMDGIGTRGLPYSDMRGIVAALDFAHDAKQGQQLASDPALHFCLSLLKQLSLVAEQLSAKEPVQFPKFVHDAVERLLMLASISGSIKDQVLEGVWASFTNLLAHMEPQSTYTENLVVAFAVAIEESPAQIHVSFTANLVKEASKLLAKVIPADINSEASLQLLLDHSRLIAEVYRVVAHNLMGYFLIDTTLVANAQTAWDVLLQGVKVTLYGTLPEAEVLAFCDDSARYWSVLSALFTSEYYEIVENTLPLLLRSIGLCSLAGLRQKEANICIKEFLARVTDEHLEYDVPRTELAVTAIEVLGLITFNSANLSSENIDFLVQFLLNPNLHTGNSHIHIAVTRNSAIDMLKKALTVEDSPVNMKSVLFTFVNTLQNNTLPNAMYVHESCVAAIVGIIPVLSLKQAVQVAIPAILRRIESSSDASVSGMWDQLEILAATGSAEVLEEVFPYVLASVLKGDRIKFESSLAPKMATPLRFLEKLLEAFVEKVSISTMSQDLGNDKGLHNIAVIIKSLTDLATFSPSTNASEGLVLLFRNFWLIITSFIYAPRSSWPKEWLPVIQSIAIKTPALILGQAARILEVDLVSNSVLRLKISDTVYAKCKTALNAALFSRSSDTKSITGPICAYLLAVLQIELHRAPRSNLAPFLTLLRDERHYDTEVFNLLFSIGEEVQFSTIKGSFVAKTSIQQTFKALLRCGADRLPRVRSFSQNCCLRLLNAVPALLWDKSLICYMLDIVLFLDSRRLVLAERLAVLRAKLGFDLHFVDETEQLQAAKEYKLLCTNMLNLALGHSLSETTLTLQGYLLDLQINFPDLLGDRSDVVSLLSQFCSKEDVANDIIKSLNARAKYIGEVKGIVWALSQVKSSPKTAADLLKDEVASIDADKGVHHFITQLSPVLQRCAAYVVSQVKIDEDLVRLICWTPLSLFDQSCIETAIPVWNYVMSARPDLGAQVLNELISLWKNTMDKRQGLYARDEKPTDPFMNKMTYTPSHKIETAREAVLVHARLIEFLTSKFKSTLWYKKEHVKLFAKLIQVAVSRLNPSKVTSGLRKTLFALMDLSALVAQELEYQTDFQWLFAMEHLFAIAFRWFALSPMWSKYQDGELKAMMKVRNAIKAINVEKATTLLSQQPERILANFKVFRKDLLDVKALLLLLLDNDLNRHSLWASAAEKGGEGLATLKEVKWSYYLRVAWFVSPTVALTFPRRFLGYSELIEPELRGLVLQQPLHAIGHVQGLSPLLNLSKDRDTNEQRFLLYCTEVSPISAISYLSPQYNHPWILQYAFRVLEHHPVEQVFFYIPQMVQALRYDVAGYVEHFILKTAKSSQLFAHQIIWNMNANMFITIKVKKHEEILIPDPLKPKLDSIITKITTGLSGSDLDFYKREFKFFAEVTGISGKLKPFIKKSKAEKKKKIDEEMRKIDVEVGVYLPSNPESIVVDIDRDSGRPLQSHAKTPFMATFKVQSADDNKSTEPKTAWKSSIFKFGDNCRQDVLALQLIMNLYPYRVVATDCGGGVIEVIPRSISRNMMGREKVNSLPNYFSEKLKKHFVRSLAACSVVLFLISIKDRHNGNIMFDDQGHTVHIDFGFILDIAPGGIEFEASPFKLTTEFINVMGGDGSAAYNLFSDLVVKSYLALRPFAEEIIQMVALMLDSGLPCFKGEGTIKKLRSKFRLDLDDKKAAEFMLAQIQKSHENQFSRLYDRFQNIQNGIPF
ncbi:hypothetical protein BC830DRAFT_1137015 [Chytriomyces sp. MP71]|nr:hypothetical protein BC830DRAFT_1137015 [Chytriomyces sp. MP71]